MSKLNYHKMHLKYNDKIELEFDNFLSTFFHICQKVDVHLNTNALDQNDKFLFLHKRKMDCLNWIDLMRAV